MSFDVMSQQQKEYPWYFDAIGVKQAHQITQGEGVGIILVDSNIVFKGPIADCEMLLPRSPTNHDSHHGRGHGTSMAGLICGKHEMVATEEGKKLPIAGIAPSSKIVSVPMVGPLLKTLSKALVLSEEVRKVMLTSAGKPSRPSESDRSNFRTVILSASSGIRTSQVNDPMGWREFLAQAAKENNILIVAAVGNDGVELTNENGVFPATLLPIKNPVGTAYPILRVGATGYYTDAPALYESSWGGSNFGESFVDLLAPGANIPALTINKNGLLLSEQSRGTSPATAITGGTVALLSKCAGQVTATDLINATLAGATSHKSLKSYAKDGKVLNVGASVKAFCALQKPRKRYQPRPLESNNSEKISPTDNGEHEEL